MNCQRSCDPSTGSYIPASMGLSRSHRTIPARPSTTLKPTPTLTRQRDYARSLCLERLQVDVLGTPLGRFAWKNVRSPCLERLLDPELGMLKVADLAFCCCVGTTQGHKTLLPTTVTAGPTPQPSPAWLGYFGKTPGRRSWRHSSLRLERISVDMGAQNMDRASAPLSKSAATTSMDAATTSKGAASTSMNVATISIEAGGG